MTSNRTPAGAEPVPNCMNQSMPQPLPDHANGSDERIGLTVSGMVILVLLIPAMALCGLVRVAALVFGRRGDNATSVTVGAVGVSRLNLAAATDWCLARARANEPGNVAFLNAHCLNLADTHEDYAAHLGAMDLVLPDGTGVQLAALARARVYLPNTNGTDLFPMLCDASRQFSLGLYLFGAREGVAAAAGQWATQKYPGVSIAGARAGYVEPGDIDAVIEHINASGADILLIGMGSPIQEAWLMTHRNRINVPVCLCVGGLFDFYSGRIPRAPAWIRSLGSEWIWRMAMEPGRLWRRYLFGNFAFLARIFRS